MPLRNIYIPLYIMTLRLYIILIAFCHTINCAAQYHQIYNKRIATLKVVAGDDWLSPPVIKLNGNSIKDHINISFDDFTHDYHRYTYKIQHCNADWTASEDIFENDYIEGFTEGNTIDDFQESINTNTLYIHYKLRIPNEHCNLKMSGNYKLTIYDEDNDNQPVLSACFMVVDPRVTVRMEVTSNTDATINNKHQQVSMEIDYGNINVTDPDEQIKTVVTQNGRYDNARINAKPQYKMSRGLRWHHNRDYIFDSGNEYRKYEILAVTHPTMGIDSIRWDGTYYDVYPFADEPRPNYVYDEDANGAFYIRNSDNIENDFSSEYVFVNYTLRTPQPFNGDIYINGIWTYGLFTPEYKMTYFPEKKCYKARIWQKQGYYSYQYLMIDNKGCISPVPSEGNFYQTENRYQAYIYYRGTGERADRLVGYQQVRIN